jgi:hypothetical protein
VVAILLLALVPGHVQAAIGQLRWSPPPLVNPTTIQLGPGVTHTVLNHSKDYIIKLPPFQKVGGTEIEGGHNVVIEGGSIAIPPNLSSDAERRGIYIKNNEGTVHVEGVLIQGQPGSIGDGIDISAPHSIVQLENDRIVALNGGQSTFHADVIQPWGGVRDLRVDGLTGSSNYQGLFLAQDLGPIGSVSLQHVNLFQTPGPYDGGGHMLWITSGISTCTSYPLSLSQVYIQPRAGRSLFTSVWPQLSSSLACPGISADGGLSWPSLGVSGGVAAGMPAAGDFVPAGVAGIDYASPGYRDGTVPPSSPPNPPVGDPPPAGPVHAPASDAATSGTAVACTACSVTQRTPAARPTTRKSVRGHRVTRKHHHKKKHKKRHHKTHKHRHHRHR